MSIRVILLVITLTATTALKAASAGDRFPVPSSEQQKAVAAVVHEVYGEEQSKAKTATQQEAFARKLFKTGKESPNADEKFVLYQMGHDVAVESGSVDLAIEITDEMSKRFDIDQRAMQVGTLTKIAGKVRQTSQAKRLVPHLASIIEAAIADDDIKTASGLLNPLEKMARRARDGQALNKQRELEQLVETLLKIHPEFVAAKKTLQIVPDDVDANQTLGEYYGFLKDDWSTGLSYLAKGNDPKLRDLAERTMKKTQTLEEQIELGDQWYDYAENKDDPAKESIRCQAVFLYQEALKSAKGLKKVQLQHRIEQVDPDQRLSMRATTSVSKAKHDQAADDLGCSAWADKKVTSRELQGHTSYVECVAFSPDGKRIASGGAWAEHAIRIWDVESGKQLGIMRIPTDHGIICVAFSPDGKKVVSGSGDQLVRIWDAGTGRQIYVMQGHGKGRVQSVAFSPDGKWVVSSSDDKTVRVWDVQTGQPLRILSGHGKSVFDAVFSPDGKQVASASKDRTVCVWDVKTGKPLSVMQGHQNPVRRVAFTKNGREVISACFDKAVCNWDVKKGRPLHVMQAEGSNDWWSSVAFSSDGKWGVSGSGDKKVYVWDALKEQQVRALEGHNAKVSAVAISPDGKQIVSGSGNKELRVWELGK